MRRLEGERKVTGGEVFAADHAIPGLTHARLVLSPHASARIAGCDLSRALGSPGVIAVVTGADLPAPFTTAAPPLARDRVLFAGQAVVAVVAETEAAAADAAALVEVDYEPLEPVLDSLTAAGAAAVRPQAGVEGDDSAAHGAAVGGSGASAAPNVPTEIRLARGDVRAALDGAAHRVRGRWTYPWVHPAPMEPHAAAAQIDALGECTVWTSTQAPFAMRDEVALALGCAPGSVRVVSLAAGGAFGLKAVPLLEPLVALLARRVRRPVRCVLTRTEEFQMVAAGGGVIDIEIGADAGGMLCGLRADMWFDGGVRPVASSRLAPLLLFGTYRLPAYECISRDVVTNRLPSFPYRAPSAISFFALESALDELARECGVDPIELRLRNACRTGDERPDGKPWASLGLVECLERAREHPLLAAPLQDGEAIGVAAGVWAGGGGPASATCGLEPDGSLIVRTGYRDLTGSDTSLAMVTAGVFGVPAERVRVVAGDTSSVSMSGQAGGSRTVYAVGTAVKLAAERAREQVLQTAAQVLEIAPEDLTLQDGQVRVAGAPSRGMPLARVAALVNQAHGSHAPVVATASVMVPSGAAPMATVHLCRVRADAETGDWRISDYAVIQDVGHAINPPEIAGQVHGGVLQSVGRALGESMVWDETGQLRTASFVDYPLPTVDQVPPIAVDLVELPAPAGPLGARGAGEPPAIPGAAAVANALRTITGRRLYTLPFEPEDVAGR